MPKIAINGMSCGHCTASVTKTLENIPGISQINVELHPGQATFEATDEVNVEAVKEAIRAIGFEPQS